ncbi:unnamed protein product [Knipowitschia caucasica]
MARTEEEEYKVIIKFKHESDRAPNTLKLSSAIRDKIGEILNAKVLSNGNVLVFCRSEAQRKKALALKHLADRAVESYIPGPSQSHGIQGVIYGVDTGITEEELIGNICGAEVSGVRRFKTMRKGERSDSTAVLLTFKDESLPQKVSLGYLVYPVKPYVRPPLRCYKCQRFGHIAAVCRGSRRCGKCAGDHDRSECTSSEVKCCNCGGNHMAAFRGCEHGVRAQRVEEIRLKENVTYAEAVKRVSQPCGAEQRRPPVAAHTQIPENSFIVDKTSFFAFLVEVLWAAKQVSTPSAIKAMIAKEAGRFLDLSVSPEHLNLNSVRSSQSASVEDEEGDPLRPGIR